MTVIETGPFAGAAVFSRELTLELRLLMLPSLARRGLSEASLTGDASGSFDDLTGRSAVSVDEAIGAWIGGGGAEGAGTGEIVLGIKTDASGSWPKATKCALINECHEPHGQILLNTRDGY